MAVGFLSPSGVTQGLKLLNTTAFTTSSGVIVDNVFSTTYDNYLLNCQFTASSLDNRDLLIYFRSGGSDTTTLYATQRILQASTTLTGAQSTLSRIGAIDNSNPTYSQCTVDIKTPFLSQRTCWNSRGTYVDSGGQDYQVLISGYQNSTTSFTGFKVLAAAGTISGTLRVYGYQNS